MKIVNLSRQLGMLFAWFFLAAYVGHLEWIGESHAQTPLTVAKTAVNPSTGASLNSTTGGSTIRYLIEYGINTSVATPSLANVTGLDTLPSDLKVVAGTSQYPTAWTDVGTGLSFTNVLLFPGVATDLSAYPPTPPNPPPPPAPPTVINTNSGGGDGWIPIIYHSADSQTNKFFEMYHHQDVANSYAHINCQDFSTGNQCSGYPKSLKEKASGQSKIDSQMVIQTVQFGNKLYYPARDESGGQDSIGLGCWDMQNDVACQYIELDIGDWGKGQLDGKYAGVVNSPARPNAIFATWDGLLYCYDVGTNGVCGGYPKRVINSGNDTHSGILAMEKYVFVQVNQRLACWDITTNAGCSGWSNVFVSNSSGNRFTALHPILNGAGALNGVCLTRSEPETWSWEGPSFYVDCWNLNGSSIAAPNILSNNTVASYVPPSLVLPGTAKVYYPIVPTNSSNHKGAARCWDFASNAACAGFQDGGGGAITGIRRWNQNNASGGGGNVGTTYDYGYAYDAASGCMFGLGDSGKLWSFDPATGSAPCVPSSIAPPPSTGSVVAAYIPDPRPFCDGSNRGVSWDTVELRNTPSEVASVTLTVYDGQYCNSGDTSACTSRASIATATSSSPNTTLWSIPLGGVSYSTYPNIVVQVSLTYKVSSPASFPNFSMRTLYSTSLIRSTGKGAFGQICLNATVAACPVASKIDNFGEIWGGSGLLGQGISDLTVPADTRIFSDSAIAVSNTKQGAVGTEFAYQATYQRTNWSGELTAYPFDATGDINEASPKWTASSNLPSAANRKIYTSSALGVSKGVDFVDTMSGALLSNFGSALQAQKDVVNYLRGDRSLEISGSNNAGQKFRYRTSPLGDIMHSAPVYYKGNVFVQANDGMLHAFDANTGAEVFAYIPNAVLPQLSALSSTSYSHKYLTDGQMAVDTGAASPLLVASAGGIAPALFGLDISALPGSASTVVKWESTSSYLGQANGAVQIAKLSDGTRIGIVSNGMGSANKTASLLLVNLTNGAITPIDTGVGSVATPNGLSAPTLLTDAKGVLQFVYAGDMLGNMWRFSISSATSGSAFKLFSGVATRPISAAPAISRQFLLGAARGYMVYFGTGKPIDRSDPSISPSDANIQSMYGVFDKLGNTTTISRTDLVAQIYTESVVTLDGAPQTIRVMSTNTVDYQTKSGWYIDLLTVDERVVAAPQFRDERVGFVTTIPYQKALACYNDAIISFFMEVDAVSGGQTPAQVFVFNNIPAATPIFNGRQIGGTVAGIPSVIGTVIRSSLVSSAEKTTTPSGTRATQRVMTKLPNAALKRQSWQQLF